METLLNVTFPLFAIMALGYGAGFTRFLGAEATAALNRFVFYFALPPALFLFTARAEISQIINWPFIATYMLGTVLTVGWAVLVARAVFGLEKKEVVLHGFLSVFSNAGYMGIPLFLAAFGPQGILPVVVANLIGPLLSIALVTLALEALQSGQGSLMKKGLGIVVMVAKNPLLIASGAGIAFSVYQVPIPLPIANLMDLLAATAGPTALFALGLSLVGHSIMGDLVEITWITILRLIVHPFIIFLLTKFVFSMDDYWAMACVILAALPIGSTAFLISEKYDVAQRRTSAAIATTTIFSVFTLSGLMIYFDIS